jgi:beta-N-acetylhexosaminidase
VDLDTAIGALIIGRVPGMQLDADTRDALKKGLLSGITLFKDNAESLSQLMKLVDAARKSSKLVPIITADQEGGAVQRFDHLVTPLPSAMALGALRRRSRVREIAELSAKHLKLLGLNCVLSPVLDVATNPQNPIIATRAYSSSPALVAKYGAITAETFLDNHILPVAKHFPGHGDTSQDSHLSLPALTFDRKRLNEIELAPFRQCLRSLPAVLTAHIWLTEFEKDPLPASLSPRITTQLLRVDLGFDGLVFTDDMLMKAVDAKWGYVDGSVLAIIAGADQLLVCADAEHVRKVHAAVKKAVKDGRISETRLQKSLDRRRIAMEAAGIADRDNGSQLPVETRIKQIHDSRGADQVASLAVVDPAIALIRGQSVPDLREGGAWTVVVPDHPRYRLDFVAHLTKLIRQRALKIVEHRVPVDPKKSDIVRAVQALGHSHCILLTYKALRNPGQIDLGHALAKKALSTTVVACDVPEDLEALPEWENAIATYDPSDMAMEALAHIFIGWTVRNASQSPL